MIWGVLWHSKNRLDGLQEYLIHKDSVPALFKTRTQARAFIAENYGHIVHRKDLRQEPHGWRMPRAIKVIITPA